MTSEAEILLLEFYAGRIEGHDAHYLRALEEAFRDRRPIVWAPYRDGWARLRRPRSVLQKLALGWRAYRPSRAQSRVVVVQDPWPVDVGLLALASISSRRNAIAVFVLRRTGQDGFTRSNPWQSAALRKTMKALIRRGWLYPASDSALALDYWRRQTGVPGTEVSIPPPPRIGSSHHAVRRNGPVLALVGSFRRERGAGNYDAVIRAAVDFLPDVTLHVQLGGTPRDGSLDVAGALRSAWHEDPRIQLHEGHLSDEEYSTVLASADVVVLPYDAESYATGTSGVLHEAVALGATVLTTPFAWAKQRYGEHPQVRFLEDLEPSTLERELRAATQTAVGRRTAELPPAGDDFARSWERALEGALERLRWRTGGKPGSGTSA